MKSLSSIGEQSTQFTLPLCPLKVWIASYFVKSINFAEPSSEAVNNLESSLVKLIDRIILL